MNGDQRIVYKFGEYELVPGERKLVRLEKFVQLPPKAFDLLVLLVSNSGELVTKAEILEHVWPGSFVEESNIQVQISFLRKALTGPRDLIETVPKIGYRFTAPVEIDEASLKRNGQGTAIIETATAAARLTVSDSEKFSSAKGRRLLDSPRWRIALGGFVLLVVGAGIYYIVNPGLKNPFWRSSGFSIASMQTVNMTLSGNAHNAAISPDGRFIAYQVSSEGLKSLWLTELDSGGNVQIMPPTRDAEYDGLIFSTDGQFLYYRAPSGIAPNLTWALYRIPKVGGSPVKLVDGVDSPCALSPDGKHVAFVREDNTANETLLLTASINGSGNVREIARFKAPDYFARKRPSWSPDGTTVACIGRTDKVLRILTADLGSNEVRPLTSEKWVALQDVEWLPDSDSLLVTAQDDINFGPLQVWRTSVSAGGKAEKITPEVVNYVGLSLDRAARVLVTTKSEAYNNVWIVGREEHGPGKMALPNHGGGRVDMSWTRSGRIVYLNAEGGGSNIYSMLPDGSDRVQLTFDGSSKKFPIVSPDDRYIIYIASSQGRDQLWRMDKDGQNQRLLVPEWLYRYPVVTPDSKWVIYTTWKNEGGKGYAYIWKVPIDGGDSIQVREPVSFTPDISPDGTEMAYLDKQDDRNVLRILPLIGKGRSMEIEVPKSVPSEPVRWTPDGRALTYIAPGPVVPNLWLQSLDGSPPVQVTNFTYDPPRFCEWSRDQKLLSCVRSNRVRDIVLFKSGG